MSDQEAKSNMTYLRNMLSTRPQFAAAEPRRVTGALTGEPFASNDAPRAAPQVPRQRYRW